MGPWEHVYHSRVPPVVAAGKADIDGDDEWYVARAEFCGRDAGAELLNWTIETYFLPLVSFLGN